MNMLPVMKSVRFQAAPCLVFTAIGALAVLPQAEAKPGEKEPQADAFETRAAQAAHMTQAINPGFTTSLYQQLRATEGNVFFSPHGISEAMAMLHAGTEGNTAAEVAKAMSYSKEAKHMTGHFKAMRAHLTNRISQRGGKLSIANALCITGMVPKQAYQNTVRDQFGGELFAGGLDEINGWVKEKTDGNIEKILESLSADSACVLLNAVYFKGSWQNSFMHSDTHKAPFHLATGKKTQVEMMMQESRFKSLREQGVIAVEMPYKSGASMVVILPDTPEGMGALEERLSPAMFDKLCNSLGAKQFEPIQLFLPKFKIATEYDLIPPMKKLGMKDAFDSAKSDFSPMYGSCDIEIAQIKHKATLEVDEKGSVATAVTAMEAVSECAYKFKREQIFRFDRPFLALIRENTTGTILFMGRISDPTK